MKGIITKGVGGTYTVKTDGGEDVLCQIRGSRRRTKLLPAVGDHVEIDLSGDPDIPYVLNKIYERKNYLVRPPVANLDHLILTFAADEPQPDLKLLDKLLIICSVTDIDPIIVFTKKDLNSDYADQLAAVYCKCGYNVFVSGKDYMADTDKIKAIVKNGVAGFAGPSGVGKSTLINHLLEDNMMNVGVISDRLKRGKHTTRHVELFDFGDGLLCDTPGFTRLSLYELGIEYRSVSSGYPEITRASLGCRFDDCRHINERDCKVLAELSEGNIDEGRYSRYKEFYMELYDKRNEYSGRKRYEQG